MSQQAQAPILIQQPMVTAKPLVGGILQRKCACGQHTLAGGECEECRKKREGMIQRSAVSAAPVNAVPPIVHDVLSSPGQPLDAGTQAFMESHFGHDFSQVRVHRSVPAMPQTKLTVNWPGDVYEQEADQVAEQVMRMPVSKVAQLKVPHQQQQDETLHRQPIEEGEEEEEEGEGDETLQAKESLGQAPSLTPELQSYIHTMKGGGQPLPESTRAFMEPRIGHDFSQVRVHTDTRAVESARAVNARAYTIGRDVVFGEGQYAPWTSEGRRLMAHELVHVVQQQSGTFQGKVDISQHGDRYEQKAGGVSEQVVYRSRTNMVPGMRDPVGVSAIVPIIQCAVADESPSVSRPIVEDETTDVGSGQTNRSDFLTELADSSLAGETRATSASCPVVKSMTARVQSPSVNICKGMCRLGPGCCTTPRGQCGSNQSSGATITATVETGADCTGELAFIQNVITSRRRRTLTNGIHECSGTESPRLDGGHPWKGCIFSVTNPGLHTLSTDDCPNIRLRDEMVAAIAADSIKTFLLWKPIKASVRTPIAHVTWGWGGETRLRQGKNCAESWALITASHQDGKGEASSEQPVSRAHYTRRKLGPVQMSKDGFVSVFLMDEHLPHNELSRQREYGGSNE